MGSKDRQCLVTFVRRATWELDWVHGEFSRTLAFVSLSVARERERMMSLFTQTVEAETKELIFVLLILVAHMARRR